jgi:hypothetical protein
VGCNSPTPEKIETWKGTQHGPEKLRAAVHDDGGDPHLRGLALAALVEIGAGADGIRELSTASADNKAKVVHEAIEPLTTVLGASVTSPTSPTKVQRNAKDGLFEMRGDASPADKASIDKLLVRWTTIDLAGRAALGGESTEKILLAVGAPAAPALAALAPVGPDLLAARLLGQVGDIESWATASGALITQAKRAAAPSEQVLQALGLIGDITASGYLIDLATQSSAQVDVRTKALYALALKPFIAPGIISKAAALAADAHAPGGVREAAFQLLEKIGAPAVPAIIKLFTDANATARYRAMEAALKAGGAAAVGQVLAALPEDRPWKADDLDAYVIHDLTLLGKDAVPALIAAAQHPPALGQIAALRALAQVATSKDGAALTRLASDTGRPKALSPSTTVGEEARRTEATLRAGLGRRP